MRVHKKEDASSDNEVTGVYELLLHIPALQQVLRQIFDVLAAFSGVLDDYIFDKHGVENFQ